MGLREVRIPAVLSVLHEGEPIAQKVEVIELGARDAVISTDVLLHERERIVLRLKINSPEHSELLQLDEDMDVLKENDLNAQGFVVKSDLDGGSYRVHVRFSGHFMISRSRKRKSKTVKSQ